MEEEQEDEGEDDAMAEAEQVEEQIEVSSPLCPFCQLLLTLGRLAEEQLFGVCCCLIFLPVAVAEAQGE